MINAELAPGQASGSPCVAEVQALKPKNICRDPADCRLHLDCLFP